MNIISGNYYNTFTAKKVRAEKESNNVKTEPVSVKKREYIPDIREQEYVPIERDDAPWFIDGWYREKTLLPSERLKSHSTLRENEWFDSERDITKYDIPLQYDVDDVPLSDSIMRQYKRINLVNPSGIDTDIPKSEIMFNRAIHSPWIHTVEPENMEEYLDEKENIILGLTDNNRSVVKDIFKTSELLTRGKNQVNQHLCNLSVELLANSGEWGDCERNIIKSIKIPVCKNVYGNFSKTKYCNILSEIDDGNSNEVILSHLIYGPSNEEMFL